MSDSQFWGIIGTIAGMLAVTTGLTLYVVTTRIDDLRDSLNRRIDDSNKSLGQRIDDLRDSLSQRISDLSNALRLPNGDR